MIYILIIYLIGIIYAFTYLEDKCEKYYEQNPNKKITQQEKSKIDSMIIIASMFSWIGLILMLIDKK